MSVFSKLNALMQRHPLATSVLVTSCKASIADAMIQKTVERKSWKDFDFERNFLFFSFGACYQGGFQYYTYNKFFERVFGVGTKPLRQVIGKILATNLIIDPCCFFPVFYSMKECLYQREIGVSQVKTALGKYYNNAIGDITTSWAIWFPAHCVTYGMLQPHLRMPWIASVSFAYVCVLSFMRGQEKAPHVVKQITTHLKRGHTLSLSREDNFALLDKHKSFKLEANNIPK